MKRHSFSQTFRGTLQVILYEIDAKQKVMTYICIVLFGVLTCIHIVQQIVKMKTNIWLVAH